MPPLLRLSLVPLLLIIAAPSFAQVPLQTLRGRVSDADNARPLAGASVSLSDVRGLVTDENGQFSFPDLPVGRYRLEVSFVGYESLVLAEVLVEAGKEAVQDVALREQGQPLPAVTVKAAGSPPSPLSVHTLTVEEQFRFPANFNDPARLAMSFPGVAGVDDQGNSISVRGNSPASVKWRLEGVEIINPNHTANAGTFSDHPTLAGGGVNILSAQVLGNSHFLTGAFPAEYGNALGGILDMRLRRGNDQRHEFTAQAGLIGLEAAAEGPFGKSRNWEIEKSGDTTKALLPTAKRQLPTIPRPSYLINYRYSFTGLLTNALGVDFGGEAISFQDLSMNLSFPTQKLGHFTAFVVAGNSENIFRSPSDTALIEEEKQLYNIDFESNMQATGFTHVLPIGRKSVLRTVGAYSHLFHQREQSGSKGVVSSTDFDLNKIACSSILTTKLNATSRMKLGIYVNMEDVWSFDFLNFHSQGWWVQPFIEWSAHLRPDLTMSFGAQGTWFTFNRTGALEPRLKFTFFPDQKRHLSLSGSLHSQLQPWHIYRESGRFADTRNWSLGMTKAAHLMASYWQEFDKSLIFNAEMYFQHLYDAPISQNENSTFSALNSLEMPASNQFVLEELVNKGTGKNYGLDLSLQKFIFERTYFLLSASLYRSLYTAADGVQRPSRWDGKRLLSLSAGREFSKTKNKKEVTKGVNARLAWLGGFRVMPIDEYLSRQEGRTVFREEEGYAKQLPDYLRLDLRLYLKWEKTGRNSLLSLDIQNATNRRNVAYEYYDSVKQGFVRKWQLGLIPVLSYRISF